MYTKIKEATDVDLYRDQFPVESERLIAWFLMNFYKLSPDRASDCITDGPNDCGIDAIYIDEENTMVHIIQSKFTSAERSDKSDISDLKQAFDSIVSRGNTQREGNAYIKSLIPSVGDAIRNRYFVRFEFLTTSEVHGGARTRLTNIKKAMANTECDFKHSVEIFDSTRIDGIYTSVYNNGKPFTVDFTFSSKKVAMCCKDKSDKKRYHFDIPFVEVLKIPEVYSGKVFECNPRKYLGANKLNKEIEDTVDIRPDLFGDGNLGVTAVCNDIEIDDVNETITLKGMQIVNGCQTVNAIFNCSESILSNPITASGDEGEITLKVIVGAPSEDVAIISTMSNKQNGMKLRDFLSQDEFILAAKRVFETAYPGGKFIVQRGTNTKNCNPDEVLDMVEYGNYVAVWNCQKPSMTNSEKTLLEGNTPLIFRKGYSANNMMALYKIGKLISSYWLEVKRARLEFERGNKSNPISDAKASLSERRNITKYKHMYAMTILAATVYGWSNGKQYENVLKPSSLCNKLSKDEIKWLVDISSNIICSAFRKAKAKRAKDNLDLNTERWVGSQECDDSIVELIEDMIDEKADDSSFVAVMSGIRSKLSDDDFEPKWVKE